MTDWPAAADRRATQAIIDLDVLAGNVRRIRGLLGRGVALMAVVKANGYGHGAVMTARTAVAEGAAQLGVATVTEGVQLRQAGLSVPILVLGPVHSPEVDRALRAELSLMVGELAQAREIAAAVTRLALPAPASIHLKIDTGMRRFGALPEAALDIAAGIAAQPGLVLAGVATHFAAADNPDDDFTAEQAARFERCLRSLQEAELHPGAVHAANSAATLRFPRYHYDMARVGIALYGLPPAPNLALPDGVRPVMTIRSRITRIVPLAPGDTVSYGRTYRSERAGRGALVPIGYADGYRRGWSSRAWMAIDGRRAPVLGRVCMDQAVVGLADEVTARRGDEIVVAGGSGGIAPGLLELGLLIDTIPYEVATGFAARIPRIFVRDGQIIAVEDAMGLHQGAA